MSRGMGMLLAAGMLAAALVAAAGAGAVARPGAGPGAGAAGVLTAAVARGARGPALTAPGAAAGPVIGRISDISQACPGQNAEVEQAVDAAHHDVYEAWMGCRGIGFARSTDGGRQFSRPARLPGSVPSSWDPAVTVAPDGTVYASFMISKNGYTYPVVDASFNHGRTFPQRSSLVPPYRQNWGDRDFITAGPSGTVYVSWDYGPSAAAVTFICAKNGSCAFATGDLNVVTQKSTNGGRTWGPITPVSPGFPASGGDSAPMVTGPRGQVEMEYQGYHITNPVTYTMTPAHSYFTASPGTGAAWSAPVRVGPSDLTMSLSEWWIDGAIGIDAAGNLYITWDSQHAGQDTGWLSYSTDGGRTWSPLQRVTPGSNDAAHIVQVAGGPPGVAYVGWLSGSSPHGYAEYLRPFSLSRGWLSAPVQVSRLYGRKAVWPGDTFGISAAGPASGPQRVYLSWGSATGAGRHPDSEIFAAVATYPHGLG